LTDEYQTWLNGLKVGDKVALLYRRYGETSYSIAKIEKITPTRQIKLDGYATKFKNGDMIDTSTWKTTTNRIVPITDDVKEYIEKKRLIAFIKKVELDKLDVQQLRKIKEVMGVV
jgi:hypothetical protein